MAQGSTTTFGGWERLECCVCSGRINKTRDGAHRFHMDDVSGRAFSWHVACSPDGLPEAVLRG